MAAQYGSAKFIGRSRRTYNKQFYCDDTAGNPIKWDAGAGALTGDTFFIAPEDVVLKDFAMAAATTKTQTQLMVNSIPTGDILLNSLQLASVTTRPELSLGIRAGAKFAAFQLT